MSMSDNQRWSILQGDALKVLGTFAPNTFDAVITDPPYASGGRTQAEKNKSTARKYSSMGENAPPPFDGDAKDQRSWTRWAAEWLYEARKVSFFLEKVRTGSACIGINLPLKKRPAVGGEQPTPPMAALAQASRKCTFAQLAEDTPVPNAACWRKNLRLYAAGRRKMWMRTRKNTICTSY